MRASSETLLLVDIVKRILAVKPVPAEQLNSLIAGIGDTLIALRGASVQPAAAAAAPTAKPGELRRAVVAKPRGVPPVSKYPVVATQREPLPPLSRVPAPVAALATVTSSLLAAGEPTPYPVITRLPTRGRGRPRLSGAVERTPAVTEKFVAPDDGDTVEAAEPAEPQLPRLLRRSEIEGPAPSLGGSSLMPTTAAEDVVHRGIVRWFDPKKQLGALRIAGYAEGISIDSEILRKAGIVRLYKGQEIEARVRIDGNLVELLSLSLAGAVPSNAERAEGLFGPRRQSRGPVVEMKRDALRKTAARLEAEQLFSRGARVGQSGTTDK